MCKITVQDDKNDSRRDDSNVKNGNFRNIILKFTQPSHQGDDQLLFIPEFMEN